MGSTSRLPNPSYCSAVMAFRLLFAPSALPRAAFYGRRALCTLRQKRNEPFKSCARVTSAIIDTSTPNSTEKLSITNGVALKCADESPRLHVVFVHPCIHWNAGNIGRTCLGLGARLHLVGPLGFSLDAAQVRRAGLDYWQHVDLRTYENWEEFLDARVGGHMFFYTKYGEMCATEMKWPDDGRPVVLVFGSEVNGFDGIRDWLKDSDATTVAFPMVDERFRSFNLSTTASMALWDAYKSLSFVSRQWHPHVWIWVATMFKLNLQISVVESGNS